jgi:hypothetical protein
MALENLFELNSVNAAPHPSAKITIPSASTLHVKAKQALAPVAIPSRVQPGHANKAGRMTAILASIEEDNDSTTAVPRRRKRPTIESDPEDMFYVPKDVEQNPMAPVKKKCKQQAELRTSSQYSSCFVITNTSTKSGPSQVAIKLEFFKRSDSLSATVYALSNTASISFC